MSNMRSNYDQLRTGPCAGAIYRPTLACTWGTNTNRMLSLAGEDTAAYGWIALIFQHQAWPGAPVGAFVRADWADVMDEDSCTGLVQIKWDPQSNFNENCSVTSVQELVPYNLAFLPADIEDQEVDRGTLYSVIDRHLTFVDPDRL